MKMTIRLFVLAVMATALAQTGCIGPWHRIDGNSIVITETRDLASFREVYNTGEFEVYVIRSNESKAVIEAESNLIPLIEIRVRSGYRLEIETDRNLDPNFPMKVYLYTPEVNKIVLSGSGMIRAENVLADHYEVALSGSGDIYSTVVADEVECQNSGSGKVEVGLDAHHLDGHISGSGDIELWGTTDRSDLHNSGSGSFRAYELVSFECFANISGSGNMLVNVTNYLEATISGSGSVYYLGNPTVSTFITGSGSVTRP